MEGLNLNRKTDEVDFGKKTFCSYETYTCVVVHKLLPTVGAATLRQFSRRSSLNYVVRPSARLLDWQNAAYGGLRFDEGRSRKNATDMIGWFVQ